MKGKRRLSASVDADLLKAIEKLVRKGRAETLSAWVNAALKEALENEAKMQALDEFFADYEREHGAFTKEELDGVRHEIEKRAIKVRAARRRKKRSAA
jgi:Arc/MetJ-type ribon-helix-helix transcriptional regulator